jgi:hypothetical protein
MVAHVLFFVVGAVIGALVFRNNPKKSSDILDKAEVAVDKAVTDVKDRLK